MHPRLMIGLVAALLFTTAGSAYLVAERADAGDSMPAASAEMKWLERIVGEFEVHAHVLMMKGPDAKSTLRAVVKPIMGGRFIQEHMTGMIAGSEFESMAIMGYNEYAKHYFSTAVDTNTPGSINIKGMREGDMIKWESVSIDVKTGKPVRTRGIERISDDGERTIKLAVVMPDGGQIPFIEMRYVPIKDDSAE
ncbi:MAG: hypothetical protein CMJ24_05550 [Phycisphaerae bacterium]|nr:hypothetical protein [Phycisphaerae bacterium]MDG1898513.1 DUF1579 family protein [Phycisphaerales bacterium]